MNRKYVIIKAANDAMVEIVANRIYTDKVQADTVCKDKRDRMVAISLAHTDLPEGVVPQTYVDAAERVAKGFIKVYELVATDLN